VLALVALGVVIWDIFFGLPMAVVIGLLFVAVGAKVAYNWRKRS
jgi:hypothetical protein